jgi:hypothetical protein
VEGILIKQKRPIKTNKTPHACFKSNDSSNKQWDVTIIKKNPNPANPGYAIDMGRIRRALEKTSTLSP